MPLIDPTLPQPAPTPQTIEQGEFQLRKVAANLRQDLIQKLGRMKTIAQRHGVSNMAAQLNATNAGDAALFNQVWSQSKTLLATLDQAAADEVGNLS